MMIDLNYDELVLLLQLVNVRFCELQRKDPNDTTPFEVALFKKLHEAHEVERGVVRK